VSCIILRRRPPFIYNEKIERFEEAGERRHLFFPRLPHPLEVGEERKGVDFPFLNSLIPSVNKREILFLLIQ
jgi:hypothetical protein